MQRWIVALLLLLFAKPVFALYYPALYFSGGLGQFVYHNRPANDYVIFALPQATYRTAPNPDWYRFRQWEHAKTTRFEATDYQWDVGIRSFVSRARHWSVGMGIQTGLIRAECSPNCPVLDLPLAYYMITDLSADPYQRGLETVVLQELLRPDHQTARYGILYTGFGYHFVPDAPVHPYMGGRIGFGVCKDLHGRNDPCRTWTYGANLGLEVDLGQAFVDLEVGADLLNLSIFRNSVQHDYPYLDNRITFRMGFVLGPGDTGHELRPSESGDG